MRARERTTPSQSTAAVPSIPRSLRKRSPLRWISQPLPLTGHLVALTLGVLLPVLILAAIVAVRYAEAERRNLEMQAQAPVTDLAHRLDAEIHALTTFVLDLAGSEKLHKGDLTGFYERATRNPPLRDGWVVLADRDTATSSSTPPSLTAPQSCRRVLSPSALAMRSSAASPAKSLSRASSAARSASVGSSP